MTSTQEIINGYEGLVSAKFSSGIYEFYFEDLEVSGNKLQFTEESREIELDYDVTQVLGNFGSR